MNVYSGTSDHDDDNDDILTVVLRMKEVTC